MNQQARIGAGMLAAVSLLAACSSPRSEPEGIAPARLDAGAPSGSAPGADGPPPERPGSAPECPAGQHPCSGTCVDNTSPLTCGRACEPCPPISGGSAICDGQLCGISCPAGKKPCLTTCVDQAAACDGCPPGMNACNGSCVPADSVTACGFACTPCPTSPNGTTSCDGDKCALVCNAGYHRCGDACVSERDIASCGTSCSPCQPPMGGEATCDGARCGSKCPAGSKLCAGTCIPTNDSCNGVCPPGRHDCDGNCVFDSDVNACGRSCTKCQAPANAEARCDQGTCTFSCRAGYHRCGEGAEASCRDDQSASSCGTMCSPCPAPANGTATCVKGACSLRCNGGYRVCGAQCAGNDKICNGTCAPGFTKCGSGCVEVCLTGSWAVSVRSAAGGLYTTTWVFTQNAGVVSLAPSVWSNGAQSTYTVMLSNGRDIRVQRTDTAPMRGYMAAYFGQATSSTHLSGTVNMGTWQASR